MEFNIFQMGIYIKDIIFKENLMDMVNILGSMALVIKDSLQMVFDKGKELG